MSDSAPDQQPPGPYNVIWDYLPGSIAESIEAMLSRPRAAIREAWPTALHEGATAWMANIEQDRRYLLSYSESEVKSFVTRLDGRWHETFEYLQLLHLVAFSALDFYLDLEPHADNTDRYWLIARLYGRCVQTLSEIRAMLAAGFSRGAMARWRALEELTIVLMIIQSHKNEIARAYIDHVPITTVKDAEIYLQQFEDADLQADLNAMRKDRERLIRKYGPSFKSNYGWAASLFDTTPNLSNLRELADLEHMHPYYRLALHGVHNSPASLMLSIQVPEIREGELIEVGPSNFGLADPAQLAGTSITQAIAALASESTAYDHDETLETSTPLLLLTLLGQEINASLTDVAVATQRGIEADEAASSDGAT